MQRKEENKGLARGVYPTGKTFRYHLWNGIHHINGGSGYSSKEEAEYKGFLKIHGHHWQGLDRGDSFGFIYKITHRVTGKAYIGSKQFHLWDGPRGGYKCTDKSNEWYDEKAWKPNDWREYTGSSIPLNIEISQGNVWDYTYEVLHMCVDKMDILINEMGEQLSRNVLEALGDNGEYLYYNENIARVQFRAPFSKADAKAMREKDEELLRNYYLKPLIDINGFVIPYGNLPKPLETGGFSDVS